MKNHQKFSNFESNSRQLTNVLIYSLWVFP
uniref:Uncharacterized protein n=1 Tax=Rhizophora mucronata TaxID=61149 RepID=A0A2P2QFK8_RHIMU